MTAARRLAVPLTGLAAALALAACGSSSQEDSAKDKVCSARADISKQVDTLKGLTASTATVDQVKSSVQAIGKDLQTIADAQGDLSDDRRDQVKSANQQFKAKVQEITSTVLSSTSLADAKSQLSAAGQQLADTYQQTFAKVDC